MSSRLSIGFCVLAIATLVPGAAPAYAYQCDPGDARLVVRASAKPATQRCVVVEREADGVELLRRAGHRIETRDYGGDLGQSVCSIDGEGTSTADCPSATGHWHLWLFESGVWAESILGPSSTRVSPGATIGWTWQTAGDTSPPPDPAEIRSSATPPEAEAEVDPGRSAITFIAVALGAVGLIGLAIRRRKAAA